MPLISKVKTRAVPFLFFSFLSSLGDSVFLTGVPLFFFQEGRESLVSANYVAVMIAIALPLYGRE